MLTLVSVRVRDILATHQPSPIKPETEKVIRICELADERHKDEELDIQTFG